MAENESPKVRRGAPSELVKVESMVQLAVALPLGCGLGWLLGSWLDARFHLHWINIAGIVLGAVGGFIQIAATAARFLKDGRK